ncbi:MAG: hypothetical protein F4Z35_02475 [Dehalococcoidia bacterium]|nr:hypothetical protein [Dehalococcoidia bacterium]
MLELILAIVGAFLLITVGILAVRAVNSQRRVDRGINVPTNGDYVGGGGRARGDYIGSGHF